MSAWPCSPTSGGHTTTKFAIGAASDLDDEGAPRRAEFDIAATLEPVRVEQRRVYVIAGAGGLIDPGHDETAVGEGGHFGDAWLLVDQLFTGNPLTRNSPPTLTPFNV